jgi:hypothetical protein
MIHEIQEIVKSLSPEEIVNTIKTIHPDDVIMRISSNYNSIESSIRNYPVLKHKITRIGRITKVRFHNRVKKIRFGK